MIDVHQHSFCGKLNEFMSNVGKTVITNHPFGNGKHTIPPIKKGVCVGDGACVWHHVLYPGFADGKKTWSGSGSGSDEVDNFVLPEMWISSGFYIQKNMERSTMRLIGKPSISMIFLWAIFHGYWKGIPSGKLTVCELEHGPVEIVAFPIQNGVFPSVFC